MVSKDILPIGIQQLTLFCGPNKLLLMMFEFKKLLMAELSIIDEIFVVLPEAVLVVSLFKFVAVGRIILEKVCRKPAMGLRELLPKGYS
jgi:hypothetical protein